MFSFLADYDSTFSRPTHFLREKPWERGWFFLSLTSLLAEAFLPSRERPFLAGTYTKHGPLVH